MCGLAAELSCQEGIKFAIYADDITIWSVGGSEGCVESSLQAAVDCVEAYIKEMGLKLSPSKSELLLYRPTRRGPKPKNWKPLADIDISLHTAAGQRIPRVDFIRVLGMIIEANGQNGRTIDRLTSKTEGVIRLIARISNSRGGLREDNLLRLFHAFLMSHINYVASMHKWQLHERTKLNTLIRKSIKRVLGLPMRTSTDNLMNLGVHNTLEEVIEAQQMAQVARLSVTSAGRKILIDTGHNPLTLEVQNTHLTDSMRSCIKVSPLPRNIHPQYNVGRRVARASSLLARAHANSSLTCFVDAAQYGASAHFAVVSIDTKGRILSSASVRTSSSYKAEQMAIAFALLDLQRTN